MRQLISVLILSIGLQSARADQIDDFLNSQLTRQRIAGFSLAVIKDGQIVKAKGYGFANLETESPATAETVYKIGSLSKSFFAAGIMLLVEDSKLKLDDPITRYLDGAPETWKAITIRHLLTHTSGIVENPPGFAPFRIQPDADVIRSLYPLPLLFKPGEQWSYSNAAYFILAEIIHKVTGQSWAEFLTERLFRPLNMTSTRTTTTVDIVPHRASGYIWNQNRFIKTEDWVALRPSGAFLSTVLDLARWDDAIRTRTLLMPSSWDQMLAPVRLNSGKTYPYGFGFYLEPWQGRRRIFHDGQLPGFITLYETFPDDHLSILVLMNTDAFALGKLVETIAGLYVPSLGLPVYKPVPDTHPNITTKVQRLIDGFVKDAPDLTLFSDDQVAHLTPAVRTEARDALNKFGVVRSLTPVAPDEGSPNGSYCYRLSYHEGSLFLTVHVNQENKITGWQFEADTTPY